MRSFALLLLLSFYGFAVVPTAHAQHQPVKKVKVKKDGKKTVVTPAKAATPAVAGPVLTFERTPCYGTCPAYRMQVYADGRVAYEGRRAVPLMGAHNFKLPVAAVADMLQKAKLAHFETFDKRYAGYTTDLPATIIAIRQPDGTFKTVKNEEGAPENVTKFFTDLSNQLDHLAQLDSVEK